MAKEKTVFVCSACGYETPRWMGKCPGCNAWNTLEEQAPQAAQHFLVEGGTGGSRLFAPGIVTRRAETARRGGSGPQA